MAKLSHDELIEASKNLPTAGNGVWRIQYKAIFQDGQGSVGPASIIGPGDKFVGRVSGVFRYQPSTTVTYWYTLEMRKAGWMEDEPIEHNA